jgi:hypothetical protein
MNPIWLGLAALAVCAGQVIGLADAAAREPRKPMALIPFEQERAQERGDRVLINLNEDITRVPAFRVVELPIVDGKIGEHARLDDDVEIYFPFGRVVVATTEFHKYRPALLASADPGAGGEGLPDPDYARVKSFDKQLGKPCAIQILPNGHEVEMRIRHDRLMSVVHTMPARHVGPESEQHPSYRVVSGLEMRFLALKEPMAEPLYRQCMSAKGQKVTQKT